jgi:O-antigen/teichoic acid export membrane protein
MTADPNPPRADGARRGSFAAAALLTYGTNLSVSILSLANVLVVSRYLGPHGRGEVAFLITVATMTGQVASLSVQEANANIGGSEAHLRGRLATNSLVLAALCGLGAAAVVEGAVWLFPAVRGPATSTLLWIALGAVPLVIVKTYLQFLLQAQYAFVATNLAWLAGPFIGVVVNGALAVAGVLTVERSVLTWVGGQALGVALLIVYAAGHGGFDRPDRALARRTLSFGLKTHGGRLMFVGNYRADQWLVGSIAGARELGLYSVAVAWAEMLFYLPGVLTLVQRPDLVRATPAEAARRAASVFRFAVVLSGAAAIGLIVAAPFLCTVVFGSDFGGSVDDLRVLALGAVGIAALDLFPNALTAQRLPIRGMWAIGVAFVVTFSLDVALIPPFGGLGAAAATTIAYTVGGVVAALIFVRTLEFPLADLRPRLAEIPWYWRKLRTRLSRG